MSRPTIVEGGNQAFQLPASMIHTPMTTQLDGHAFRLLYWILWEAHRHERWPRQEDEPSALEVRYCGNAMRAGAGLTTENGYRGVRAALESLASVKFQGVDDEIWGFQGGIVAGFRELPGPNFQVMLPAVLAAANWRPLARYALLNMDHIRRLRQPLDFAVYVRACEVARARQPQFELSLADIAWISGSRQGTSWAALRRPFLGACERVAALAGGRFLIQAWCCGDYHGADSFLIRVGVHGRPMNHRFPVRHRALYFEVDLAGSRRYEPQNRRS